MKVSVALVPVPFRGGHLLAAKVDAEVFVPLRPMCDALGVSTQGQLARLRSKPWACIKMILSQMPGDDQAREVATVDLRSLPMWLATIEPSRVKPEARAALLAYQREAAEALARHFLAPSAVEPATLAQLAAQIGAARGVLAQVSWTLGLPSAPEAAPSTALAPHAPAALGAEVEALAADASHLAQLVGLDPSTGRWLDGVIVPSIDSRSQTVMRLRAWLAECTRPLTPEERQQPHKHRGLSATEAADSFNRWARSRGYGPMSAGSLGRWLRDPALRGTRFYSAHHKANRYALALRANAAPAALGVRHG